MTDPEIVVARLRRAGCLDPEGEARVFLAAAPDGDVLDSWLDRREEGEPVAWILGTLTFCGQPLHIAPGVYVPRPHSEQLARRAAERLRPAGRALDLCTGAGAIAAHLRHVVPSATVVGVDLDPVAARCARGNGVPVLVGDLAGAITGDGTWDLVTAVAPYVPTNGLRFLPVDVRRHEPAVALDGGPDGLRLVEAVVVAAGRLLRAGGCLVAELGGTQDEELARALTGHGFEDVDTWCDEHGDLRGVAALRGQR